MQCLCTVFLTSVSLSWSIIHIQCYGHFRCTTWYFDLYMHYKPSRSIGFSRQEYWSRLSLPSPGDLPDPRIKPTSFETPSLAGRFFNTTPPGRPPNIKWFSSVQSLSCVLLFATPWIVACQAPLSMGFPRQEYWSGLPLPPPGDLPDPRIEPTSPMSPAPQADSLPAEPSGKPW